MHEVEHMGLSLLVNILKVAVIEVFLETENCLGSVVVFSVHLKDTIEGAVVRQWILTLADELGSTLLQGHEWRLVLVLHGACTSSNHLQLSGELAGLSIGELPGERGKKVLT